MHRLLKAGAGRLVELIDLGDVKGLLQHPPTRRDQHQVVVDQRRSDRHRGGAHQGTTATDQTHAAVAADLQVGARQTAGLPEALQKAAGAVSVATAQGQQPAIGRRPGL